MDPWGNAAAQYNQGLAQLSQINQQGFQAQAQGPASIYDRFIQGYAMAKQQRMQEEQARREAEFKQQQLDIQRMRWSQEDQQTKLRETAKVQAAIAQNYRPELRGSIAAELKAINPEWDDKKIESILPPRTPETIQIDGNEPLPLMPNDPVTLKNPAMRDDFLGMNPLKEKNDAEQFKIQAAEAARKNAENERLRQQSILDAEKKAEADRDLRRELGNQSNDTRMLVAGMMGGLRRDQYEDKKAEKKKEEYNKDYSSLVGSFDALDRLGEQAKKVLSHPGLAGTTGLRGKVPDVPGSDAANARAELKALTSQVGFAVLQNMRNNSKTGGALGNVSDAEGKRLEAALGALDSSQSEKSLRENLQKIVDYAGVSKDNLTKVFRVKHGGGEDSITDAAGRREPPIADGKSGDRVKVKSKDGTIGTIPRSQLGKAKLEGYTEVQ